MWIIRQKNIGRLLSLEPNDKKYLLQVLYCYMETRYTTKNHSIGEFEIKKTSYWAFSTSFGLFVVRYFEMR